MRGNCVPAQGGGEKLPTPQNCNVSSVRRGNVSYCEGLMCASRDIPEITYAQYVKTGMWPTYSKYMYL